MNFWPPAVSDFASTVAAGQLLWTAYAIYLIGLWVFSAPRWQTRAAAAAGTITGIVAAPVWYESTAAAFLADPWTTSLKAATVLVLAVGAVFVGLKIAALKAAESGRAAREEAQTFLRAKTQRELVERTHELAAANATLHADEARRKLFISVMTHELRNPLAPIVSGLSLLKNYGSQQEHATYAAELIERKVKHMSRMISGLMDVQRINGSSIPLTLTPCVLQEIIKSTFRVVSLAVEAKQLTIIFDVPKAPVHMRADAERLEQIIGSVLDNCTKFNRPEGNIWLTVRADSNNVTVTVRDDGCGISPDLLATVTDPFVQAEQPIDRPYGGLGVGLTIAAHLVEQHGGTFCIDSPGRDLGTVVTIFLPLDTKTSDDPRTAAPSPSSAAPPRVLVVDSEEESAASLTVLLQMYGYQTCGPCNDAEHAIRTIIEHTPDMVVLDLGTEPHGGRTTADRMRDAHPDIVLIAVTESDERDSGFDHHLLKPVNFTALINIISSVHKK